MAELCRTGNNLHLALWGRLESWRARGGAVPLSRETRRESVIFVASLGIQLWQPVLLAPASLHLFCVHIIAEGLLCFKLFDFT